MCGCPGIIRKTCRLLRIENRDIDARIADRCVDRRRGQQGLGRCGLTLCARIRCVATFAGNIAKGKVTTRAEQEKQEGARLRAERHREAKLAARQRRDAERHSRQTRDLPHVSQ